MNRQNERASKFLFSFKLCRCTPIVRASRAIQAVQIKVAKVSNKILNWRISISDIIPFKIISFARKKDYLSISIDQNDGSKFFFFFETLFNIIVCCFALFTSLKCPLRVTFFYLPE